MKEIFAMKTRNKLFALLLAGAMTVTAGNFMSVSAEENEITDPNGNGTYEMADAIYIYQYLAGGFDITDSDDLIRLDFSGNGIISNVDGLKIQYYIMTGER